jgi:catechol 2,3-dioxygenase-like lactoylglutathione lyase family enzyme
MTVNLSNAPVHPTIPVGNIDRAKRFYQGVLGLKLIREDQSPGAIFQAGEGTFVYIYQGEPTKDEHTLASFHVDDIESAVKELGVQGVVFEEYDLPGIKTVKGIATVDGVKAAWFKDTEGNILAVTNMTA